MTSHAKRAAALLAGAASFVLAAPVLPPSVLALGALGAMGAAPAAAQPQDGEPLIDIQGWQGGAFGREDTGEFSHCGISKSFDNGITLVIQTNPELLTNIALVNPDWSFEQGAETAVQMSIDGTVTRRLGAVAAEPQVLAVPTGNDPELYQALRRGNTLTVATQQGQYQFPLTGTARSLNALRQCVEQVSDLVERNPEAVAPPAPEGPPNAMPIEALASILNAAGLEDLAFMAPEAVPDNALDLRFVWRTGTEEAPVIGGLHQEPRGEEVRMERFAEGYVNTLREFCPEGFSAELGDTEVVQETYALKAAEAECVTEEGADFVSLFFALDDFNYSVFYHMTSVDNRAAAEAATEGVERVVRGLANQAAEAAAERETGPDAEDGDGEGAEAEAPGDVSPADAEAAPADTEGEGEPAEGAEAEPVGEEPAEGEPAPPPAGAGTEGEGTP